MLLVRGGFLRCIIDYRSMCGSNQFSYFEYDYSLFAVFHFWPDYCKNQRGGVPRIRLGVLFSFGLIVFISLDYLEIYTGDKLGAVLHFVRAITICVAIYCCVTLISKCNSNQCVKLLHDLFVDASKYSLQIYLFNGYLLTIIRIIICSILLSLIHI